MTVHPVFGLRMPQACAGVDADAARPARDLGRQGGLRRRRRGSSPARFEENFERFAPFVATRCRQPASAPPA